MDCNDTIAAIGTAADGAARGMIRISGPEVLGCLSRCFVANDRQSLSTLKSASVIQGAIRLDEQETMVPCDLFLWPSSRSYTHQPSAELHTIGSPPLLETILQTVCHFGTRPAEPGEFTMRAFLAGRLDLTQAEAVLGVINARGQSDLDQALSQLAGGLSGPLQEIREQLLQILAELEAGLDFADEDLEFISQEDLNRILSDAQQTIATTLQQMDRRTETSDLPRVALVGLPNVGKSSLFNAIVESCVSGNNSTEAIVSGRSGTTRDYVTAMIELEGLACELVDTAGEDDRVADDSIDQAAQSMSHEQREQATLRLVCIDPQEPDLQIDAADESQLIVLTKSDLMCANAVPHETACVCSSTTGEGIEALKHHIVKRLQTLSQQEGNSVAITAARCANSLSHANSSLLRAIDLCAQSGVEELIAAEIRVALIDLGTVIGTVYTDDVLDRIFSQFCIGK